ncbi:SDR family NAD(P)-dependent oxidoreductase [Psychromonas sp. MME2]|uniref:SDR family NAD(P)-dependent oxidoreductase n=1 Tax=unclassified Psychromonas TaxID=2614957 RepID=UPI00339C594A
MKRILITGATSGIGKALCLLYQAKHWQVIACGRNEKVLAELANLNNVSCIAFDLTNKAQINAALLGIPELDVVILNAGNCEYIDDPVNFDGELFERVISTNVIAVGHALALLLPKLKSGGGLALMGSSASYLPFPRAEAYGASKAAISYLAKVLSLDLQTDGIAVSLINPGFIKTPLTAKNDFPMPMLISAEQAAQFIFKGITQGKREIHFPRVFTGLLKLFAFLPDWVWRSMAKRMKR